MSAAVRISGCTLNTPAGSPLACLSAMLTCGVRANARLSGFEMRLGLHVDLAVRLRGRVVVEYY